MYKRDTGNKAGYGIIQLKIMITLLPVVSLNQPCSVQLGEIKALTAACKLAAGKKVTIYTDSAYAYGVCHVNARIWRQRGFNRSDWHSCYAWTNCYPVTHGQTVKELIQTMQLPLELAIVKCAAHQYNNSLIAVGNNLTDMQSLMAAQNVSACQSRKKVV